MRHKRIRVRHAALAGAAVFCFSTAVAKAGEVIGATQVPANDQIENIVISGFLEQDLPKMLSELGARVDVVTSAQIQNGGYIDVSQALQSTVPGLYIAPKNGPFDYVDISLQGSRTQDVLWTVDGVRINNRLYAGTTPLDTLPASMIERIEVLEGPQALFYGTQAVAGAINIVTKDFSDTPDGRVSFGGDTIGGKHADGYFRDTFGHNHFVVYIAENNSEGFRPFPRKDFQPSATDRDRNYQVLTVGGKYAYDFSDALRFSISEEHTEAKLDFAQPELVRTAYNERNEDVLTGKVDYRATDQVQFFVKGYYHWWHAHYTEFDNDVDASGALTGTVSTIDDHDPWGFDDYGLNAMAKFTPTPEIETYAGYDFQAYDGSDAVLVIQKKTEDVHAFFGEIATTPALLSNVRLAAGFRYNAPSVGQTATVWNVTGRWDATPNLFVKGMVGTTFRLPTAEELFANDPDDERGNPNLKPEEGMNFNGSVGGNLGMLGMSSLHWEAIGFWRTIRHFIDYDTFDATTNQDVFGNLPGRVETGGGEIVVDAAISDDISANLSYTDSRSTDSTTHKQINRVPEQLFKTTLDYHPMNLPFGLFASVNYVGTVFDTPAGIRTQYGNYAVVDLGGRAFIDVERHHRIDVGVRNVFDKRYTTRLTSGFPDDGGPAYVVPNLGIPRTFFASYSYHFF